MQHHSRQHHQAIGMFDSGVGGLTVMKQIMSTTPYETIIYFGDTANLPYGEKSRETIIRYSIENTIFLMEQEIKMLVIPCNTVSSYSIEKLRKIFNIPVIGVIEPGAEKAVEVTKNGRIAVLGTKATIKSGMYQKEILSRQPNAQVFPIACPLFVPLIEEQFVNHPATELIVREYLSSLQGQNVDTVLLGCTHYPLIREAIARVIGPDVNIVDSATTCAEKVSLVLNGMGLQSQATKEPEHRYVVSDDPEKFKMIGRQFLGMPIDFVATK